MPVQNNINGIGAQSASIQISLTDDPPVQQQSDLVAIAEVVIAVALIVISALLGAWLLGPIGLALGPILCLFVLGLICANCDPIPPSRVPYQSAEWTSEIGVWMRVATFAEIFATAGATGTRSDSSPPSRTVTAGVHFNRGTVYTQIPPTRRAYD